MQRDHDVKDFMLSIQSTFTQGMRLTLKTRKPFMSQLRFERCVCCRQQTL